MNTRFSSNVRNVANWAIGLVLVAVMLFSAVSPAYAAAGDPITGISVGDQGTALTYTAGGSAAFVVTFTSNAAAQNVILTAAGLPAGVSAVFSPAKLAFRAAGAKPSTLTLTVATTVPAGTYPFSVGTKIGNKTGAILGHGSLVVDKLLLAVGGQLIADKPYDGTANAAFNPQCTDVILTNCYTLNGAVGTDDVHLVTGTADFLAVTAGAQDVAVAGLDVAGAQASNYTVGASMTASANITPAPLDVTAHNVFYYMFHPTPLVYTNVYAGFVNGEGPADLPVEPSCTATPDITLAATYPIICSGGSGGNYEFNFLVHPADPTAGYVTVSADNQPPSALNLSGDHSVAERLPVGTLVGNLTTTDPELNLGEVYQYSLVDTLDCAGPDKAAFNVPDTLTNGDVPLQTAAEFHYVTKASYSICVRTFDGASSFDQHFDVAVLPSTAKFSSSGVQDGWILESGETTTVGGTKNNTSTKLMVGDDAQKRQYRSILSFGTKPLPDNATIYSVTIKVKKAGLTNADIFKALGALRLDVKKPSFGKAALELGDFKAAPGMLKAATFGSTPDANGWYTAVISTGSPALQYINLTGGTQFRIYFAKDDNNNTKADTLSLYSGNAGVASRPVITITYSVP